MSDEDQRRIGAATLAIPAKPAESPHQRLPGVVLTLISCLVGGAVGYFAVHSLQGHGLLVAVSIVVGFLVVFWLQVVLHEAGHALAGIAVGLRPIALGVGPIRLQRGADRWHFRWTRAIQGIGGFAILLPPNGEQSVRQSAIYLFGGPLMNLAIAAIAAPFAFNASGSTAAIGIAVFGSGVFLGLVNLVPFVSGGWSTDGRQLLKLWHNSDETKAIMQLNRMAGLAMLGVRPRDWPMARELDLDLTTLPAHLGDAFARCQLAQALDRKDYANTAAHDAAARLATAFWTNPDGVRQFSAQLIACWAHEALGELDLATAWLQQCQGGLVDMTAQCATLRAAIALDRGDAATARTEWNVADHLRRHTFDAASRAMLDEELELLRHRLNASDTSGRQ